MAVGIAVKVVWVIGETVEEQEERSRIDQLLKPTACAWRWIIRSRATRLVIISLISFTVYCEQRVWTNEIEMDEIHQLVTRLKPHMVST